jgi:ABC-type Fe3+ transport system substrate-binding protein
VVDKVAAKHGTTEVAKAYLEFLYSDEGQEIGAKNYYRPRSAQAPPSTRPLPEAAISSPSTNSSAAGKSAEAALRRRRRVRQDLHAGPMPGRPR